MGHRAVSTALEGHRTILLMLICALTWVPVAVGQDGWKPRFTDPATSPISKIRRDEERVAQSTDTPPNELPRNGIVILEAPEPDGQVGGQSLEELNDPNATGFEPQFMDAPPPDGVLMETPVPGMYGYGERRLKPNKEGFFQRLGLIATWLDRDVEPADLGMTEIETFVTVAVPLPTRKWPLVITPAYNLRLIEGPDTTELPPRLHSAYLDFIWLPQFTERFSAIVAVRPGIYSDFEKVDSDAMRIMGAGLLRYTLVPGTLDVLFGAAYLDRQDINILPVGGLIWTPNPNVRYELLVPKPKLAHRIGWGCGWEDWLYLAGEFGGGTWEIERFNGTVRDQVTLRDLRAMIGLERKKDGGAGFRLEIGYVFLRKVEFNASPGGYEPDDTVMIRGGVVF